MVNTYKDPAKQRSREKLRSYIDRHLLSHRKAKDVKVICFPGAEVKGEEALEVKEVYLPLGIPVENITGLEYSKEQARRIERAGIGIETICQDAHDFFKRTNRKFDIISLDYTGQRTWRESDTTRYIAGKRLLNTWGVFCTNHSTKRESKDMQERLLGGIADSNALFKVYRSADPSMIGTPDYAKQVTKALDEHNTYLKELKQALDNKEIDLQEIREAITICNIALLSNGTISINPKRNMFENNQSTQNFIAANIGRTFNGKGLVKSILDYDTQMEAFQHSMQQSIANLVSLGIEGDTAKRAMQIIAVFHHKGYIPINLERYTYTSNKNSKMLMDMVQVRDIPKRCVRDAQTIVGFKKSNGTLDPRPSRVGKAKYQKAIKRLDREAKKEWFAVKIPDTIDLGSSWKAKQKISKQEAIELLKSGCSTAEIAECYNGFKGEKRNGKKFQMQLAALKAHYVTMKK